MVKVIHLETKRLVEAGFAELRELSHLGQLPLPKCLSLELVRGPSDPSVQTIADIHRTDFVPHLSPREPSEIVKLATAPSQLLAIIADYEIADRRLQTLAGHYAIDDREAQIELCFDRSFVKNMRLHSLAIDYRLFLSAISLIVSGRDQSLVRLYAAIDDENTASRGNYKKRGAIEKTYVPGYLRADGGASRHPIRGVVLSVFSPDAVYAGFMRMIDVLRKGAYRIGDAEVKIEIAGGEISNLKIAEQLAPAIKEMCERQETLRCHTSKSISDG